jgi:signal peptidase
MKKNKLNSILRIVLIIFTSILIGGKLYSWNAKTIVGNELAMPFGYGITVVLSGSMEPELSVNDVALIKAQSSYSIGDVVVYQDGNSLVIHRIVSIEDDTIITQGDANNVSDNPIDISSIKGKEVAHISHLGVAVMFFKSSSGFLTMLIIAIVLLEVPYYLEKKKSVDEQEKIKEEIRRLKNE